MQTLGAMALIGSAARADVWGVTPRAGLTARYDQNIQLSPDDDEGQAAGAAYAGLRVVRYSDAFEWSLDPQFSLVRYPELRTLNRNEGQVIGAATKHYERGQWVSAASYHRDTTITSERGATGLTESNLPHEKVTVSMTPSLRFAELWNAAGTVAWSTDRYLKAQNTGLVDYDYSSVGGQLSYSATERTTIALDGSFGRLDVHGVDTRTDQSGLNLRIESVLNEKWKASLSGGPLRVKTIAGDESLQDNGVGYAAKLSRLSETASWSLNVQRDTIPNGRGVLSKRDQATTTLTKNFTSRLAADVSAQWTRSRDAIPTLGIQFDSIRYFGAATSVRWQSTPTISISASVGWNRQEILVREEPADSYTGAVTVTWQGFER